MAEAGVEQPSDQNKFFCHECSQEIHPKMPDLTCPRCNSGFIEEMTSEILDQENTMYQPDAAAQLAELWGRSFLESVRQHTSPDSANNSDSFDEDDSDGPPSSRTRSQQPSPYTFPRLLGRPHIQVRRSGSRNDASQVSPLDAIVQQIIGGITGGALFGQGGGFPITFNLGGMYGNPGDYAWGAGGLDAIITQFLNQLDGTGPPPAPKDKIDNLPTVKIVQEQIDVKLQCSVCMEDFNLAEEVRKLPCNHHYHKDCIIPWLELHGTCPVCRKTLDGKDTSRDEAHQASSSDSSEQDEQSNNNQSSDSNPNSSVYDFIDEYD